MLTSLSRLGAVGSRVIKASKDDTVANLNALRPVLKSLNDAGDALPQSLQLLLTYPFSDKALDGVKGDYTNLWITADLDARSLLDLPSGPSGPLPGLPGVPGLPACPTSRRCRTSPPSRARSSARCVQFPGTSCPAPLKPGDTSVRCRNDALPSLVLPFKGTSCPKGWTKVSEPKPAPSPTTTGGGGGGGGGICVPGVLCLGADRPYDQNLAGLMMGGVS